MRRFQGQECVQREDPEGGFFFEHEAERRRAFGEVATGGARPLILACDDLEQFIEVGLGAKARNIAGEEPYEVTDATVAAQVAKLRATGATVFVIFATPKFTIQAYVLARSLGWSPPVIYTNSISGTDTVLTLAQGLAALV